MGSGIPLSVLPEGFRSFSENAVRELRDHLTRTVRVMRWRQAGAGPHSPFSHTAQRFSLDGTTWHPLPMTLLGYVSLQGSLSFRGRDWEQIVDIVARGGDEPFSHELYREAWEQRTQNPRSALLLGIAALEIGIKECVAELVPDAEWLVLEAPSPPVARMLREYLPGLPTQNRIAGKVLPPPDRIIEELKRGIGMRNQLAHRGHLSPSRSDIDSILEAASETLWLLAYYAGWDWALDHLAAQTRDGLVCPDCLLSDARPSVAR